MILSFKRWRGEAPSTKHNERARYAQFYAPT